MLRVRPGRHKRRPGVADRVSGEGVPGAPVGSLADALALKSLTGALTPIKPITADLDLEPGTDEPTVWRDSRWRVRWPRTVDELPTVIGQ